MRLAAALAFLAGLLLAVRVMFFGVRRQIDDERFAHRAWPLALAAFLTVAGMLTYGRLRSGPLTLAWAASIFVVAIAAASAARWLVLRSAAKSSTDPEDDPRYRFQGHVARVLHPIGRDASEPGRIVFEFDGRRHELSAVWSEATEQETRGPEHDEVVIERVEGDIAFVEPWTAVEQRL